jgi:hypothetical protein
MSDDAVQRLIADICLRGLPEEGLSLRAARLGVRAQDLDQLAKAPTRLALYRRLVRTNLLQVTTRMMRRTRARLNAQAEGAFEASFDEFLADAAPTTHYLRDVPMEFLVWAAPRWGKGGAPTFASDLARYELAHFQIAIAPPLAKPPAMADVALDKRLVFTPARRFLRLEHAVHLLPDDLDDRSEPARRPTFLFLYRDAENNVRDLELTPVAATIADELLAGAPLGEAVKRSCAEHGAAMTPAVLSSTAAMLADWGERGLLLGASESA